MFTEPSGTRTTPESSRAIGPGFRNRSGDVEVPVFPSICHLTRQTRFMGMPERERARTRGFPAYVDAAVERRTERDLPEEALREDEAACGPIPRALRDEAAEPFRFPAIREAVRSPRPGRRRAVRRPGR
ncbi:hypothetical protein GCM10027187_10690 [Streptosporangium sandarakinum]